MREVIASATRANVSIYGIDPRGLTSLAEESIEASGGFPADPQLNLSMQSFQDELRLSQMSLRSLSEDTGGYAAVNSNDFTKAWDRVVADNSSYYVLGYYPKNEKRDGRFRKLEVKVRREGARGAHAEGLHGAKRKGARARRRSRRTRRPRPSCAARSTARCRCLRSRCARSRPRSRGAAPNASVAVSVEAEGADLAFQQKEGKFVDDLEVSVIAHRLGREAPRRHARRGQHGTQAGNAGTRRRRPASGCSRASSCRRDAISCGWRRARPAAVVSVRSPTISKCRTSRRSRSSMSGIVIGSVEGQSVMTAKTDEELRTVLPLPPTASREFRAGDGSPRSSRSTTTSRSRRTRWTSRPPS